MSQHVIIDGNNLLHAMPAHAPLPAVGRETLVRVVERWAARSEGDVASVTLVFDGPRPQSGMARQMSSDRVSVRFSAPITADDVIVELIQKAFRPDELRVVTSDSAIRHEARLRRCRCTDAAAFARELFATPAPSSPGVDPSAEKPSTVSESEVREWLDAFGLADGDDVLGEPGWPTP